MTALERCERRTIEINKDNKGGIVLIPAWCVGEFAVVNRRVSTRDVWAIVYRGSYIMGGTLFGNAETACAAMVELAAGDFCGFDSKVMSDSQTEAAVEIISRNGGILLKRTLRALL